METQKDIFGNTLPIVKLPEVKMQQVSKDGKPVTTVDGKPVMEEVDVLVPETEVEAGPEVKNDAGAVMKLDICYVQRGDLRGAKYWSKEVTEDNFDTFVSFYGKKYCAARLNTINGTENQKVCLGKEAITDRDELLKAIATKSTRGETNKALSEEMKSLALKLTLVQAGTKEHTEILLAMGTIATKLYTK